MVIVFWIEARVIPSPFCSVLRVEGVNPADVHYAIASLLYVMFFFANLLSQQL